MSAYAYYNGRFLKKENVYIPLTDRAFYFGDAVYDVAIGARCRVHLKSEHIERLLSGARTLGYKHGYSHESISNIIDECVEKSGEESYMIYIQMSRNAQKRSHSCSVCDGVNLLVYAEQYDIPRGSSEIKLVSLEDKRYRFCNIKTVNLLPAVIASTEAEAAGCEEAVFIRDGIVTECAHSNISILKDGTLYTHPTGDKILPGITRRELLNCCVELSIKFREAPFRFSELLSADEVLVTSTTKLLRRACSVDGVKVGCRDGKTYSLLCEKMFERFNGSLT